MKVKQLKIEKLYGYFDKEIDFNQDINLLVGINGSGKTSILNIITWMLMPSLPYLSVTAFEKIELLFNFNNKEYLAEAIQDQKNLTYSLKNITDKYSYHPLTVDLHVAPNNLINNELERIQAINRYLNLNPNEKEVETWNLLSRKIPKPIVIGLDRNLFVGEGEYIDYEDEDENHHYTSRIRRNSSPLERVKGLANDEYSKYRNSVVELNRELRNKIMLSAFEQITPASISASVNELNTFENISIEQVEKLQTKVQEFFEETIEEGGKPLKSKASNQQTSKINKYFVNLKKLIKNIEKSGDKSRFTILFVANINQFKKIKSLIDEFAEFDKKSQELYSDIKLYLDTINDFLKDSSKRLEFNKELTKLNFNILDKKNKVVISNRDINNLSSGEKQILILFTYLKFHDNSQNIFIIDEPELSLHPKWQEDFLTAIKKLMPKQTQLIIATHSPSIVGDNKNYCKVLLPYNE